MASHTSWQDVCACHVVVVVVCVLKDEASLLERRAVASSWPLLADLCCMSHPTAQSDQISASTASNTACSFPIAYPIIHD